MKHSIFGYSGPATVLVLASLVPSVATAAEMIKDGDFEKCRLAGAKCGDWELKGNATVSNGDRYSGQRSALVGGAGNARGTVSQKLQLVAGTYTFSFAYERNQADINSFTPVIVRIGGKTVFAEMVKPADPNPFWVQYQIPVQLDSGPGVIEFVCEVPPGAAGPAFLIDSVSLKN